MAKRICSVEDCGKPLSARGLCVKHYEKARWAGNLPPRTPRISVRPQCSIDGCGRPHVGRGWCQLHYNRWQSTGDPLGIRRNFQTGQCSVDGCDEPKSAKGYCRAHYHQNHRGPNPVGSPIKAKLDVTTRDELGRKHCSKCERWLPTETFTRRAANRDGLRSICKSCDSMYFSANAERVRAYQILKNHGITIERWNELLESQDNKCAICRTDQPGAKGWATDHDHSCCPVGQSGCGACIRGILCGQCNTGIGLLKDDPATLRAAIEYLERPRP